MQHTMLADYIIFEFLSVASHQHRFGCHHHLGIVASASASSFSTSASCYYYSYNIIWCVCSLCVRSDTCKMCVCVV